MEKTIQKSMSDAIIPISKLGEKLDIKSEVFDIYKKEDKRFGTIYSFVQIKNEDPMVYTYSISKGNLTRGKSSKWARQELRSTSKAFHKDKENKMAIPNDVELAIKISEEHLSKYKPRKDKICF